MSNIVLSFGNQMPSLTNIPQHILARAQEQVNAAAANTTNSLPRISFSGRSFHCSVGGDKVELPERLLDVHIVSIDPTPHYVFFEHEYSEGNTEGRILSRHVQPDDPITFVPTAEFKARVYKQRCVLMLANDPDHNLYVADFGYRSIKGAGNPRLGLLTLSQLITQFKFYSTRDNPIMPFMFTIQMSFTPSSVPELQFSFTDQRQQGNTQARFASPAALNAMIKALDDGTVDSLMNVDFDSNDFQDPTEKAAVQQPVQVAPQSPPQGHVQSADDSLLEL